MPVADPLLSPAFLARLERLSLISKRPMRGQVIGGRRSLKHGASVEFSDFREYVRGDDLRYVDWKAYGRLDKLFVKLFLDEDDLSLHLLLDASSSMRFGQPKSKLRFAQELSAAMGAIALLQFDRCSVTTIPRERVKFPVLRGRGAMATLLRIVECVSDSGQADLAQNLRGLMVDPRSPGVLIIMSDFYRHGLTRPLLENLRRRFDVTLIHVLSPEEVDPSSALGSESDVRLTDSESSAFVELSITPAILEEYAKRMNEYCKELESLAWSSGAGYMRVTSDMDVEEFVMNTLRQRRVVR